jgi:hypothetical protein
MTRTGPVISDQWLQWMRDYRDAAKQLADMDPFDQPEGDTETLFVKFALFARTVTLFDTAVLLAEHDKLFDLRNICREVLECAIHMDAAFRGDDKSRWSRAKAYQERNTELNTNSRRLLQEFLNDKKGKLLKPSELSNDSDFPGMAHTYREISADTAHVTYTALVRHAKHHDDGSTTFTLDPLLTDAELHETLAMLGLSAMICTLNLVRMIPTMSGNSVFFTLNERFRALQAIRPQETDNVEPQAPDQK